MQPKIAQIDLCRGPQKSPDLAGHEYGGPSYVLAT